MVQFSRYNICIKNKNKYIIYNSISGVIIELAANTYKLIKTLSCNGDLDLLQKEDYEFLCNNNILADDSYELDNLLKHRETILRDKCHLSIMIHPTLRCNINCSYCYQSSYPKEDMNKSVAEDIINFVIVYVREHKLKQLELVWSGGEPLLAIDLIEYIVKAIKTVIPKTVHITMKIISNGILLSDDVLKRMSHLGIDCIQVTIDGVREVHNKRRSVGKYNSYVDIMNNISNLLHSYPSICLILRVNVDKDNLEQYHEIIDYFKNNYKEKNYSIFPAFVFNNNHQDNFPILTKKEEIEVCLRMCKENRVYLNNLFSSPSSFCMKKSQYSFAIGPDGSIYDCELKVGDKISSYINVHDIPRFMKYLNIEKEIIKPDGKCLQCSLLPLCNYGCIFKKQYNNVKSIDSKECHQIKGYERQFILNNLKYS